MLLSPLLFFYILLGAFTKADQISITALPLYSQADLQVQLCVTSGYKSYITSYGCALDDPATCLCTDASKSYRAASAISTCIYDVASPISTASTATEIWASYCLTNAGIHARDQTLLQDFALFTQATWNIRDCATSVTSSYSKADGCDFLTPASCLCATSASSSAIQSAMLSCASEENVSDIQVSTIAELWSSYCQNNTATSATRFFSAVAAVTTSADPGVVSSAAPSSGGSPFTSKHLFLTRSGHTSL